LHRKANTSDQEIPRLCRLGQASALLKNPALSIEEITHRLGPSRISAFTQWLLKTPRAIGTHAREYTLGFLL